MKQLLRTLKLIALYDERRNHWYNRYIDAKTERAAQGALERYKEAENNMQGAIDVLNIMGFTIYVMETRILARHCDGLIECEYIRGESGNE